jgi:hypothetical protein
MNDGLYVVGESGVGLGVVLRGLVGLLVVFITGFTTVSISSSSKTTGCGLRVDLCVGLCVGLGSAPEVGLGCGLGCGLGLGPSTQVSAQPSKLKDDYC